MTLKEQDQLNEVTGRVREWWSLACNRDQIPTDSKFVVFSKDNIYVEYHAQAVKELMRTRARIARNQARRERHAAMTDLGLKRVKGALGGTYYE